MQSLLHAYRHPRRPELTSIALGHGAYEPSGGGIKVIVIRLDWATGQVSARE